MASDKKNKKNKKSDKKLQTAVGNPSLLDSLDSTGKILQVVIETPKGSRNKYAFDEKQRVFRLKTVLPAGMAFPYDFGFVPSTLADDGDPVDVLLLMDEPAFPGCVLGCRMIGVIEGKQGEKKDWERNDRVVAIEMENHSFSDIRHINDLGKQFVQELEEFFVNYHEQSGEKYRILGTKGPAKAAKLVKQGMRSFKKQG
ncbi:MAG: inorganic diphosphatase [Candidatus Acidiferrum sp.]